MTQRSPAKTETLSADNFQFSAFWTIGIPVTVVATIIVAILWRDADSSYYTTPVQGTYETIAATGDVIDGETIASLFGAQLNNSGDVTFTATFANAPPESDEIIAIANDSGVKRVVRDGDSAPIRGAFELGDETTYGIDEFGLVTFHALVNSNLPNDRGFFRGDGDSLVQIARQRQRAPGSNGRFDLRNSEASWSMNSLGAVAIRTDLFSSAVNSGIFSGDEFGLQPIVVENPFGRIWYSDFSNPAINKEGFVAFSARQNQGRSSVDGLFLGNAQAFSKVVVTGKQAPGGGVFSSFSDPSINNENQIAFSASLENTQSSHGIFRANSSTHQIDLIARSNQSTPSGDGSFAYFDQPPLITDSGEVSFTAQLQHTSGGQGDDYGAFLGDGSHVVTVHREGDEIDALVLQVPVVVDTTPYISKWKMASFDGKGNDVLRKVIVRIGDLVAGSPVSSIDFDASRHGSSGCNDNGQVVYTVTLEDGRQLIQLFTPL